MAFRRFCTRCTKPIPEDKVLRSVFCSPECRHEDRKARRDARNDRFCNRCGRSLRKPKETAVTLKVKHPKNCQLCDGDTWVTQETIGRDGKLRRSVVRCPNWKVERQDAGNPLATRPGLEADQLVCATVSASALSEQLNPIQGGSGEENRQSGEPLTEAAQSDETRHTLTNNDDQGGLPSRVKDCSGEPLADGSAELPAQPVSLAQESETQISDGEYAFGDNYSF